MKYLPKSILFLLAIIPLLQASAELKTFEGLRPPVYEHRQGESNGVVRYIDIKVKPSISGRIHNLPSGERLSWEYSIQGLRDGVCFITRFGDIHVLEENAEPGDTCLVTVTVSALGYENKSVSVTVSVQDGASNPVSPELKNFGNIEPPVYQQISRGGSAYGGNYQFVYLESPPSVGGHTYFIPESRRPLRWTFSAQRMRSNRMSDGVCSITGFGVLRIESKNIQHGDICVVTATVSHLGYEDKSVSVEVHWYGPQNIQTMPHTPPPPTPSGPTLKTFGDIEPPVYQQISRGGSAYGGNYQFVYLESPPSVGGHTYFIPESRRPLRWTFSARKMRSNRMSDGVCSITGFGVLRIESKNIQHGDICVVTATVSHPGYEDKSVSVEVHWYGPQNIQTMPHTPPPPTPSGPTLKTFGDIEPPVYQQTSRGGSAYGGDHRSIYLESPPSVGGHTYFIPESRRPLRWIFSVQRKRGNHMSDGVCSMTGFGVLRIDLRNVQHGDICVVTATVSHPGYEDKSVSVEVHWYGPQDILTVPHIP